MSAITKQGDTLFPSLPLPPCSFPHAFTQFETKVAKHLFCKTCGICSHYRPRSNPDCVAVTTYCVDATTPLNIVETRLFNGTHWEESYAATGIGNMASKVQAAGVGGSSS